MLEDKIGVFLDEDVDVVVGKGNLHILQYSQYVVGLMDKPKYDGALFYIKPFSYEFVRFMVDYDVVFRRG